MKLRIAFSHPGPGNRQAAAGKVLLTAVVFRLLFAISRAVAAIPEEGPDSTAARDPVVMAVQKVVGAVVNISTEQLIERFGRDPFEELFRQFFGPPREGVHSLGSGVVVDEDGWIVTNYHVVRRASRIMVTLADGSAYEARIASRDEKNDLALLKIEPKKPLAYLELAGEREPMLGETVIAIGNPFGFDHTVTKGIISAKNRKFPPDDPKFQDVLQTDAAINPGSSGGPLVNTHGELVGINTAILSQAEGIGFAIPAKRVATMLAAWFSPEKGARLWLGLKLKREAGKVSITDVQAGSPAANGGLAVNDRVVAVDNGNYTDVLPLLRYFLHKKPGDVLRFAVERDGKPRDFEVKLVALPRLSAADLMLKNFGLQIQPLTQELADALGIPAMQGVLVSDVQQGSPAAEAGFRRGLVIVVTHVGGEEFQSLDQLAEQLVGIKSGEMVSMAVFIAEQRGGFTMTRTVGITLPAR